MKKFNEVRNTVKKNEDNVAARLRFWQWYSRCQKHLANFSNIILDDILQIRWKSVLNKA
jgi:hypothetical protein